MKVKLCDLNANAEKELECTSIEFNSLKGTCLLINSKAGKSIQVDTDMLIRVEA